MFITRMITDRIGRLEVLSPTDHRNYNFLEKKRITGPVVKERENLNYKTDKGGVHHVVPAEIDYNQNECDWLI